MSFPASFTSLLSLPAIPPLWVREMFSLWETMWCSREVYVVSFATGWRRRRWIVTGSLRRAELPHQTLLLSLFPHIWFSSPGLPTHTPMRCYPTISPSGFYAFPRVHPACCGRPCAALVRVGRIRKSLHQSVHFVSYLLQRSLFWDWSVDQNRASLAVQKLSATNLFPPQSDAEIRVKRWFNV